MTRGCEVVVVGDMSTSMVTMRRVIIKKILYVS